MTGHYNKDPKTIKLSRPMFLAQYDIISPILDFQDWAKRGPMADALLAVVPLNKKLVKVKIKCILTISIDKMNHIF